MLKRTPLYPLYKDFGGKTIDFGGWEMPVQFSGIIEEHQTVREAVGLFDVSHMGEFEVSGSGALSSLQQLITNDLSRLALGQALYTPMCYESGGTVDDLLIYRLESERFWVVVNASNIDKDLAWITQHLVDAEIHDRSNETALLAIQGPLASEVMEAVAGSTVASLASFHFLRNVTVDGIACLVSRTGYTGEDGFEIYVPATQAIEVCQALLVAGSPFGLKWIGLGARDTLRLEARLSLYGHELTDDITPLEAGLGSFIRFDKGDFIGRQALLVQKEDGLKRKLMGFMLEDRGVARAGYEIYVDGKQVGQVTSGTMSPTIGRSIGLALMDRNYAEMGKSCMIQIRGKFVAARLVKTPFYQKRKER